ncbi:F-box only protein 25-like [Mya arenaria]|uniref:F-box only protein 25-like n=1 Tax=Mya arenaria TaxID=6604 RepID=UPI0022E152DD|nr:F-box only protein 25-like [Mya arenaria]
MMSDLNMWVKTPRGWKMRGVESYAEQGDVVPKPAVALRPGSLDTSREVGLGGIVQVTGSKGQRKMSVCMSEFIVRMKIREAGFDIRRQKYIFDLLAILFSKYIQKLSGSAHRQMFRILEEIVSYVLASEGNLRCARTLLDSASRSLTDHSASVNRIGCASVWNRHKQTVTNLQTKLDNFQYTPREEDCKLILTDLPKECIFEIMLKFTDHRDVVNLGLACWDLYYMSRSTIVWEKLVPYHFTEKQMYTFAELEDHTEGEGLINLYRNCYKKFGLRQMYTADQLVVCSACKTLHWLMLGHHCWSNEEDRYMTYMEPISPGEIMDIASCT